MPIVVTIKNKGIKDLDSCYINWTLNGVIQTKYAGEEFQVILMLPYHRLL